MKRLKCCLYIPEEKDRPLLITLLEFYGVKVFLLEKGSTDFILNQSLKWQPDLIILDFDHCAIQEIHYEFIQYFSIVPSIIGVSSDTNQAYKSIKLGISDYLLKPPSELDIRKAVIRFKKNQSTPRENICFKNYSDYYFINPNEVLYLKADNNTTDIILVSGRKITAFKTLKIFEENLPKNFLRIHNSYIINTNKILRINFGKYQVYLDKNQEITEVPFSKSYRDKLKYLKEVLSEQDIVF